MSILALDHGSTRIGVALAPAGTTLALPLDPIVRTNIRMDIDAICNLLEMHACRTLVVGDPVTLAGTRGLAAETIDAFVEKIAKRWSGEIVRIDERLTTAQSTKMLLSADVSRAKRKKLVDGMAAALILESYLAKQKRSALE